jgi:hypothetical protein
MRLLVAYTGPTLRTPRTLHLDEAVGEGATRGSGEGEQNQTNRVTHQKLPWSEAPARALTRTSGKDQGSKIEFPPVLNAHKACRGRRR